MLIAYAERAPVNSAASMPPPRRWCRCRRPVIGSLPANLETESAVEVPVSTSMADVPVRLGRAPAVRLSFAATAPVSQSHVPLPKRPA